MQFDILPIHPEEVFQVHSLIRETWSQMPQQAWFAPEDEGTLARQLESRLGEAWKAVTRQGQQTAGIFIAIYPAASTENLGNDIQLPDTELIKVAHMDTVVVHPDYRGHRLQQKLVQHAEAHLHAKGFRYLMCTIHPENHFSLRNMQQCGYRIMTEKLKYGGLPRCILLKELEG